MKKLGRFFRLIIVATMVATVAFISAGSLKADGILLFTAGGSPYVTAVRYVTYSQPSSHLAYITTPEGKRVQIQTAGIIAQIPFPDHKSPVSVSEAEAYIAHTELLGHRYPQYARLLQGMGDLWRKILDQRSLAQEAPATTSKTKSASPGTDISQGPTDEIPVLTTKSGQNLKDVKILRFENDTAVVQHSTGMGRVQVSDIANISAFPTKVKSAIEKLLRDLSNGQDAAGQGRRQPILPIVEKNAEQPLSPSGAAQPERILITQGTKTVIPLIQSKSGQVLTNAVIDRFENEDAIIVNENGETRIALSDIQDPSELPEDVKIAIIKAQVAFSTR